VTMTEEEGTMKQMDDQMVTVFENGELKKDWNLDGIRVRAQL